LINVEQLVCALFFLFILWGCMKPSVAREKVLRDVSVSVVLREVKQAANGTALVYGTLTITGRNKRLQSANLDCFGLKSITSHSERIYVDSVAHILTNGYMAKNNKISVNVYWLFRNRMQSNDLDQLDISVAGDSDVTDLGHCVIFAR